MACVGDVPTLEILAAVDFLNKNLPELKIRVINVIDLMTLQPEEEHPHGLSSEEFDNYFTKNKPIIFAYHGYPMLIHRLTYRRTNHANLHVRGYKEEGTTTTPFDMCVMNELDRFHLILDVLNRVTIIHENDKIKLSEVVKKKLEEHKKYIMEFGEDMPEIKNWQWRTYFERIRQKLKLISLKLSNQSL